MIVYEVTVEADPDIALEYRAWLGRHVLEMLALPGFQSAEISSLEGSGDWPAWCVHYRLTDRAALERYFAEHAARLRADGVQRFGDRFRAQRRILRPQTVLG